MPCDGQVPARRPHRPFAAGPALVARAQGGLPMLKTSFVWLIAIAAAMPAHAQNADQAADPQLSLLVSVWI